MVLVVSSLDPVDAVVVVVDVLLAPVLLFELAPFDAESTRWWW